MHLQLIVRLRPEQCVMPPAGSFVERQSLDTPAWKHPIMLQDAVQGLGASKVLAAAIVKLTGKGTAD